MSPLVETTKSARRARFESDALPHLELLWGAALWLTMRLSHAEDLVIDAMTQAYHSWEDSDQAVGSEVRLLRFLIRAFFATGGRPHRPGRFLPEPHLTAENACDSAQPYPPPLTRRQQVLLTEMSSVSVRQVIAHLRVESRLIMVLLSHKRFSYADIAYITDLSENSVRVILGRLRKTIPQCLMLYADAPATGEHSRAPNPTSPASPDGGLQGG